MAITDFSSLSICLGSASPLRQELMHRITDDFFVHLSSGDETLEREMSPAEMVQALAVRKAHCVNGDLGPGRHTVIGCDTLVDMDGKPFGKPHSREEAAEVLLSLQNRSHLVHTGVCVLGRRGEEIAFTDTSSVYMGDISRAEAERYCEQENVTAKAGGYSISSAAVFFPRIEGDYNSVLGLPVSRLYRALCSLL